MNSTSSDWNKKIHESLDSLYPAVLSSFSNVQTREILVIIGLITVCFLLLILLIQCVIKVRHTYQTSQPTVRKKRSYNSPKKYPSYQELLHMEKNQYNCLRYSCIPTLHCTKPVCQASKQSPYYEEIDERQTKNSMCRVFIPCKKSYI